HAPDPATLIRVLNYGIGLERDAWNQFDYPTFHGDFLTSPEARGLFDFVQADLERSYPDGLPNAETLFSDGTLDPNIWFPPRAVWLLAQTAVVNLLRESQSTLTENTPLLLFSPSSSLLFSLTPTSHELDGDPTPEWLVEVISEPYNLHGWIPLDETADGYTLIPNVIQHENLARGESTTFQFTPDLNGDGLDDLVMHFDGQALGTGFGELKVYGINEGQVGMLKEIELGPETTFDFGNYNGDGAAELRVQIPRTYNFGCAWIQTNLYEWHSHEPYDFQNPYPPNTPLCNAAKFIEGGHLFGLDLEQSSEMVVQAISPDIAPSEDYLALLQIRLAMDYAGKLEDDKAQEILDHLITYQHSTFAFLASQVWSESGRALLPFCTGLVEAFNAGEMDRTDLAPYFSSAALLQAYGNVYASAAPFICAPGEVLFSRLLAEQIATGENPVQYLLDRNYPLLDATAINLDDDPEEEWIAGLTIQNPKLLVFDARPDAWSVLNPYDFSDPIQTLMYRVEDLPGYGALDLIVLATFAPSVPVSKFPQCEGASLISELDIFELKWLPLNLVEVSVLCDVSHPLSTLTPEEIIALIPAPAQVVTTPDDEQFFFFDLERFEQDIFREGDIPADRDGLQNLLAAVPPDHPTAPHLIPRLLFDLGLSYELEGDAVAARVAYLELIAQWPDSPWAWLAEARVGP
ncbi:MAG TPA: tetratricopeptide repeat protein, partial [Anaerolineales bacterium]|nr:tetratricopeptide repeat protein [Anaerolineales bacterium]